MGWILRLTTGVVFTAGFGTGLPAHAGKLDSVRSEVNGSSKSSSSSGSSSDSSSDSSDWVTDDDDTSPEHSGTTMDINFAEPMVYPRFPYQDGQPGYLRPMRTLAQRAADDDTRRIGGSVQAEGAYLGESLYRTGFSLDVNWLRWGLKSDLSLFLEGPLKDALYLGSTNALVTLIMRPRLRFRAGGGAQYMIDARIPGRGHREYAAGPNLSTSIDAFPFWPIILSGRFDYGKIYKAQSLLARGTLGLALQGFELYGGYEYRRIGRVALHGPTVGLRAWF